MDKGAIYTLIGGLAVILILAAIANPEMLPGGSEQPAPEDQSPVVQTTSTPLLQATAPVTTVPSQTQAINVTPKLPDAPARIVYTSNPFSYPAVHLPSHMESFGASDVYLREKDSVTFAYIEESQGGLTLPFSVPYAIWAMNITVTANRQPQYAMFRMVLCDAKGNILDGAEIQYPGTMYKVIRTPGTGMYMIISTTNVDSFRISLETPLRYYVNASSPTG